MVDPDTPDSLVPAAAAPSAVLAPASPFSRAIVVPRLIGTAGDRAAKRYANFFASMRAARWLFAEQR